MQCTFFQQKFWLVKCIRASSGIQSVAKISDFLNYVAINVVIINLLTKEPHFMVLCLLLNLTAKRFNLDRLTAHALSIGIFYVFLSSTVSVCTRYLGSIGTQKAIRSIVRHSVYYQRRPSRLESRATFNMKWAKLWTKLWISLDKKPVQKPLTFSFSTNYTFY